MFLLHGGKSRDVHNVPIGDVMSHDVVSVSPETSVWEAASQIDRYGIRRLPVVDEDGFVVGVVTRTDLVRTLARSDEDVAPACEERATMHSWLTTPDRAADLGSGYDQPSAAPDRRPRRGRHGPRRGDRPRCPAAAHHPDTCVAGKAWRSRTPACSKRSENDPRNSPCSRSVTGSPKSSTTG